MESEATELTVLFTTDKDLHKLNFEYRGKDYSTDVLSFPMQKDDYLGDLAISVQTSRKQAKTYGCRLHEEILRLLIHGILHLEGFDHEGVPKMEAQRMRRKEKQLYLEICKLWPKRFSPPQN